MIQRAQRNLILKDLKKKMVFLVGPRQVGKTSLSQEIATHFKKSLYLNFDDIEDRKTISKKQWPISTDLLILDELHKMSNWKNFLKGVYDTKPKDMQILVTGSARLSVYENIGDSLAGRYFCHHLLPLSVAELSQRNEPVYLDCLTQRSGFPEPYLMDSDTDVSRWRNQYIYSMIRTDALDFESIHNVNALQNIFELLRTKVGSPVSYQSIAQDLQISQPTVKRYIDILEALYLIFRVRPFSNNIARSLLKEPKIYFFDSGLVKSSEGEQLENLVAVSLLKHVYAITDYEGKRTRLAYLRTKDQKEVDFALVIEDRPEQLIEVKLSDRSLSKTLKYFHQKYQIPAVQLVKNLDKPKQIDGIMVEPAKNFLRHLKL